MQEDIRPPKQDKSEPLNDSAEPQEDNIFIANPEPPKAAKSNTIAWEVIVAVVALIVIAVGTALWSYMAGNSAAVKYESSVKGQLVKVDSYLRPLNPSIVINNSDIEASVKDIATLKQPVLENVIFGTLLSERYKSASQTKQKVDDYYDKLHAAANDLTTFNDIRPEVRVIMNDIKNAQVEETEEGVVARPQNIDSLRSLSGTLKSSAQKVESLDIPLQLKDIRKQVVDQLDMQSKLYADWASAIAAKKNGEISKIQEEIEKSNKKLTELTSDESYVEQFEPTYKKLIKQHESLTELLS